MSRFAMRSSLVLVLTVLALGALVAAPAAEACIYASTSALTFCHPSGTHAHFDGSAPEPHCTAALP